MKKESKIIGLLKKIDTFDESSLLNTHDDNELTLSDKKQKSYLYREGLGILTNRLTLFGTYLCIALSLLMLVIYHHFTAIIPAVISFGLIGTRLYMMKYYAEYSKANKNFGKHNGYGKTGAIEIAANMIWLILISFLGGINLIGYAFAVVFCMMSVISGFLHLIYFVQMNEVEIN